MAHPTNGKYKKISKSKQKRLARLYRKGASITQLSRQHGLPKSSIYYWGHKYYASPHSIKDVTTHEFKSLQRTASRTAHKLEICQKCLRGLELTRKEKYAFMDSIYGQYSMHEICEAMVVDRGAYYNHLRVKDKIGQQEIRQAMLKEEILTVYDASAHRYGSENQMIFRICPSASSGKTSMSYHLFRRFFRTRTFHTIIHIRFVESQSSPTDLRSMG